MVTAGRVYQHLVRFALRFREAREEHPWGETAIKVRGRTFVFLGGPEGELRVSVKLPRSREFALEYPFTKPTHYGLGKSGWVTASFPEKGNAPLDVLEAWITESYRAIAPKSLAAKTEDAAQPRTKSATKSVTRRRGGAELKKFTTKTPRSPKKNRARSAQ